MKNVKKLLALTLATNIFMSGICFSKISAAESKEVNKASVVNPLNLQDSYVDESKQMKLTNESMNLYITGIDENEILSKNDKLKIRIKAEPKTQSNIFNENDADIEVEVSCPERLLEPHKFTGKNEVEIDLPVNDSYYDKMSELTISIDSKMNRPEYQTIRKEFKIYWNRTSQISELTDVPGTMLDYNDNKILYRDRSTCNLVLRDTILGTDKVIFEDNNDDYDKRIQYAHITNSGKIYFNYKYASYIYDNGNLKEMLRDGKVVTDVNQTDVNGDYIAFVGYNFIQVLNTKTDEVVIDIKGQSADELELSDTGEIVYLSNNQIIRCLNNESKVISNDNYRNGLPKISGDQVVYSRNEKDAPMGDKYQELILNENGKDTVITTKLTATAHRMLGDIYAVNNRNIAYVVNKEYKGEFEGTGIEKNQTDYKEDIMIWKNGSENNATINWVKNENNIYINNLTSNGDIIASKHCVGKYNEYLHPGDTGEMEKTLLKTNGEIVEKIYDMDLSLRFYDNYIYALGGNKLYKVYSGKTYEIEDVNRSEEINMVDLASISSKYNKTAKEDNITQYDLIKDGLVDILDVTKVARKI